MLQAPGASLLRYVVFHGALLFVFLHLSSATTNTSEPPAIAFLSQEVHSALAPRIGHQFLCIITRFLSL